jgi:hypothetical protein
MTAATQAEPAPAYAHLRMGLRANIYRPTDYAAIPGRMSSWASQVTVVGIIDRTAVHVATKVDPVPEFAQAEPCSLFAPAVALVLRELQSGPYVHAVPIMEATNFAALAGGAFLFTNDGRWLDLTGGYHPVSLHDRIG